MSKTNTTTSSTPATSIELVDPASLLVDLNVRHDPRLDAAFSASIKELGVLVPIVAVRTAEKQLRVRSGSVTVARSPPSRPGGERAGRRGRGRGHDRCRERRAPREAVCGEREPYRAQQR